LHPIHPYALRKAYKESHPRFIDEHFTLADLHLDDDSDSDELPDLIPIETVVSRYGVPTVARADRRAPVGAERRLQKMAIEHIAYPEADNLVGQEKAFWPLKIPVS
jgi:hypothetical protein